MTFQVSFPVRSCNRKWKPSQQPTWPTWIVIFVLANLLSVFPWFSWGFSSLFRSHVSYT